MLRNCNQSKFGKICHAVTRVIAFPRWSLTKTSSILQSGFPHFEGSPFDTVKETRPLLLDNSGVLRNCSATVETVLTFCPPRFEWGKRIDCSRPRREMDFDKFVRAFHGSRATCAALTSGFLSTVEPERALLDVLTRDVESAEKRRRQSEEEQVKHKDPRLVRLIFLQNDENGSFDPGNDELKGIIGSGHGVPDPPEGINAQKWMTYLCVAFLQRFPDKFDFVRAAVEKAQSIASDRKLLEKAKRVLPPDNLEAVQFDGNYVRNGNWQDFCEILLKNQGHYPFRDRTAMVDELESDGSVVGDEIGEEEVVPERKNFGERIWKANFLREVGLARISVSKHSDFKTGRNRAILNAAKPLEAAAPLFSSIADELQEENEVIYRDIKSKTHDINKPRLFQSSNELRLARRSSDIHKKLLKKEFHLRSGNMELLQSDWKSPIPFLKEISRITAIINSAKADRPPWDSTSHFSVSQKLQIEPEKEKRKGLRKKRRKNLREPGSEVFESETDGDISTFLRHEMDEALKVLFKRVLRFEGLREDLIHVLHENQRQFREALSFSERNHAFDATTSLIVKVRAAICTVIEAHERWASIWKGSGLKEFSIAWNGTSLLFSFIPALDFLDESQELKSWFGKELPLKENPFMLAVPIFKRPVSPISAFREGRRLSADLARKRQMQMEGLEAAWKQINSGPSWWPNCRNRDEWIRIRKAETYLLQEVENLRKFSSNINKS